MKKLVSLMLALVVCATLAAVVGATDGNLMENGSFEYPDFPIDALPGAWTWLETTLVGGWTVANTFPSEAEYNPRLEVWDSMMGVAAHGSQFVELDGFDPTTISQTPDTDAGYCYELSYAWSPRPNVADNQMKVYVDGAEVAYHSASGVGQGSVSWTYEAHNFAAPSAATEIAFAEVGNDDQLGMLLDDVSLMQCASVSVGIDIKPGGYPNCFNVNGHGVIPVAVLGSDTFDVSLIDVSTLQFAGLDVRVKGNGVPQCSIEDVSGDFTYPQGAPDGYPDLVCQFEDDAEMWTADNGTATVTGYFGSGYGLVAFAGSDDICIVP